MKREIKFRAWHEERKQMYSFDIMWGNFNTGNGYIGMIPFGEELDHGSSFTRKGNRELIDPHNCEIMQYTGLKDKNGKDIYEGDIVSFLTHKKSDRGQIVWQDCGFVVDIPKHDWTDISNDMEVIGNIYENPELL